MKSNITSKRQKDIKQNAFSRFLYNSMYDIGDNYNSYYKQSDMDAKVKAVEFIQSYNQELYDAIEREYLTQNESYKQESEVQYNVLSRIAEIIGSNVDFEYLPAEIENIINRIDQERKTVNKLNNEVSNRDDSIRQLNMRIAELQNEIKELEYKIPIVVYSNSNSNGEDMF